MDPKHPDTRNSVPVAFWAVATLVFACVGAAVLLVPSESDLLGRLTIDGKIGRIREIVEEKIGHQPSSSDLLEEGAAMLGRNGWDFTDSRAMELIAAEIDDVEAGFTSINSIGDQLPAGLADAIYSQMANRALGENRPELAALIFQRLGERSGLSAELTEKIVTSLRACSKPHEALAALSKFKQANGGELPESLGQLFDTLALESGEVDTLFESARDRFEQEPSRTPEELRGAIDKLITAGSHAGRTGELLPLCDAYLATTTAGTMSWQQIVQRRKQDPGFDDPDFRHVATAAAKFCRWNEQPDRSFDLYRKLSALGSPEALQHCIDLHVPLLRESEMVELLDASMPVEGHPEYTLLAARIHAKRTDYATADGLYRQHLRANPMDAAVWAEFGGMWDAGGDFGLALQAYRLGSEAAPEDTMLQKRIARTLVTLGRFEEALEYHRQMANPDRKDLTDHLTLATNLGDQTAVNDALRKWFSLPGERRPIDYLRLARSYGALGQHDEMIAVYRRGIMKFPGEREIRLELAGELSRLRRHSDVIQVLGSSGLRDDPEAISLHLSSALAAKQYRSGLSFAGSNAEDRLELPISAKLPLAEIYYQTGSVARSERLYDMIPTAEMPTLTQATLAFRRGRFPEAEALLKRHLASNTADHRSWSFLASIYQAQRKKLDAQAAYQRALALLKQDLKRRY